MSAAWTSPALPKPAIPRKTSSDPMLVVENVQYFLHEILAATMVALA
jgi:hypothetical protein